VAVEHERTCQGCGATLRRRNAGTRCAACERASEAIPASFWYAEDVAAALGEWNLPAVVRLIHRKLGLTQMTIANLTGYSQAHISRWLNRDGNPEGVTAQRLRQFVESLGIPWELLGLVNPSARESSGATGGGTFGISGRSGAAGAEEASEQMKRRALVAGSSALFGLGMLPPAVAALLASDGPLASGKLGSLMGLVLPLAVKLERVDPAHRAPNLHGRRYRWLGMGRPGRST
jgi:transcriptional regulator with XRE-family HTH domain